MKAFVQVRDSTTADVANNLYMNWKKCLKSIHLQDPLLISSRGGRYIKYIIANLTPVTMFRMPYFVNIFMRSILSHPQFSIKCDIIGQCRYKPLRARYHIPMS